MSGDVRDEINMNGDVSGVEQDNERALLIPSDDNNKVAAWGRRHILIGHLFFGSFLNTALRMNLSVAVVAMVNDTHHLEAPNNTSSLPADTCPERTPGNALNNSDGEFNWDATTQGLVLSSFFYGYILTQVLGGQLAQYFGGRLVLGVGVGVMSVLTLLTPVITRVHVNLLIITRFIIGIFSGGVYPASTVLISKWAPMSEKSRFGAIVMSGNNLGSSFATAVTGVLSNSDFLDGWPASFYVLGSLGLLWVLVLILSTAENPERHKNISSTELWYILQTTGSRDKRDETPWRRILTSVPVWAIVIGLTSKNWAYYALLTTLPNYLEQVLKFNVSENGLLSALPPLCMAGVEILGGFIADQLQAKNVFSVLNIRRILSALGCFPACVLIFAEGFVGCNQVAAVVLLSLSTGSIGFSSSGFMLSVYDIAPRHAGIIGGISNSFGSLPGILAPSVVMAITDNKPNFTRWRWVFILSSGVYALGGALAISLTRAEEQPWAKAETDHEKKKHQSTIHQSIPSIP